MKSRERASFLITCPDDTQLDWAELSQMWGHAGREGVATLIWQRFFVQSDATQQTIMKTALLSEVRYHKAEYMQQRFVLAQV